MLTFDQHSQSFCRFDQRTGWQPVNPWQAYGLLQYADSAAQYMLSGIDQNVALSQQVAPTIQLEPWTSPNGLEYLPFQEAGIINIARQLQLGRQAIGLMDEPGCIDGKARIKVNRGGNSREYTLEDAYKRFNGLSRRNWNWDRGTPTYMRALCGGRFGLHKVRNIIDKGVKPVIRLTLESGKNLKLTADHLVLTPADWVSAGELQPGDHVIVNGKDICKMCGSSQNIITHSNSKFRGHCLRCMYRYLRSMPRMSKDIVRKKGRDGYIYLTGKPLRHHPRYSSSGVLEHVYLMEKWINRTLKPDEEVHHKNGIRHDNRKANLELLTRSEHSRRHKTEKHFGNFIHHSGSEVITIPKKEKVVSCIPDGYTRVYDVVMADPHRNFIANGMVVHNCGKTIQAIGIANVLRKIRILVVCPASLRINWANELTRWHIWNPGIMVILGTKSTPYPGKSCVVSYDLAGQVKGHPFDLVIIDENHYIKHVGTARASVVLGNPRQNWPGLVAGIPTLFLSGTPIPNGKPNEIWPVLYRSAPEIIDGLTYSPFVEKYCTYWTDEKGERHITGSMNESELYARLRGSGFMIRRLKKDVLHDLPPKRYQMIVFPQNSATRKVIKKEEAFNAEEIMLNGLPDPDSAEGEHIATVRREMGEAMVPQAVRYIMDLLDGGIHKVGIFAYHRDVCTTLFTLLKKYRPVMIIGGQSAISQQEARDSFQHIPEVRVFIGNSAAAEGHTLTAAHHVVDVEPEWVPGKNDQRYDRFHRIGQVHGVVVHQLVVEGSLGAIILGSAARKQNNINKILGA